MASIHRKDGTRLVEQINARLLPIKHPRPRFLSWRRQFCHWCAFCSVIPSGANVCRRRGFGHTSGAYRRCAVCRRAASAGESTACARLNAAGGGRQMAMCNRGTLRRVRGGPQKPCGFGYSSSPLEKCTQANVGLDDALAAHKWRICAGRSDSGRAGTWRLRGCRRWRGANAAGRAR